MSQDEDAPGFDELLDWLEGRLPPTAADRLAARVATAGEATRDTVAWLRRFLATAQDFPLHEPPPIVRQNLAQHFARWSRAQAELGQRPREVRARLLFDSRQDLALAGVRAGADDGDAAHLAYTTDDGDLLLDVYRTGQDRIRLDGQVLLADPGDAPVFEATLTAPGATVRTKDGDELGRFRLAGVPEAPCELRASNGLITIVADVDLSPGADRP